MHRQRKCSSCAQRNLQPPQVEASSGSIAVRKDSNNPCSGLIVMNDFSQWAALVNNIPTLASRLNGLSVANAAVSSHS